jgi:hypothetical protein
VFGALHHRLVEQLLIARPPPAQHDSVSLEMGGQEDHSGGFWRGRVRGRGRGALGEQSVNGDSVPACADESSAIALSHAKRKRHSLGSQP